MAKITHLFSTAKKAVLTSCVLTVALAVVGTGSVLAVEAIAEDNSIGKSAAENIALADAGIDPAQVQVSRTEFEREKGQFVYEVEFIANGVEYDYQLSATDGTIIAKEAEPADRPVAGNATVSQRPAADSTAAAPAQPQDAPQQPSHSIPLEQAQAIALADAGLTAADVTFSKGHTDLDDGTVVYELEFYTDSAEYDYEINAATGAVFSRSTESRPAPPASTPAGNSGTPGQSDASALIDVDEAKAIATQHAGVAADETTFTKAKLEDDDGRTEYEVKFYQDNTEYEYTIDASTGTVIEQEQDVEHNAGYDQHDYDDDRYDDDDDHYDDDDDDRYDDDDHYDDDDDDYDDDDD